MMDPERRQEAAQPGSIEHALLYAAALNMPAKIEILGI